MFLRLFATLILSAMSFGLAAETIKEGVSFAILGDPKYSSDFSHFDYVNPAAPKGGNITLSAIGTFDNFNRYALRGTSAARTERLYDSLFSPSSDEIGSYYPLIAESARYSPTSVGLRLISTPTPVFMMVPRLLPRMWPSPSTNL